jgi:hypothetical protein
MVNKIKLDFRERKRRNTSENLTTPVEESRTSKMGFG